MAPKRARMARPAAAVPARRRPAAAVVAPGLRLIDVPAANLEALGWIKLIKAKYYNREVEVVGRVANVSLEGGELYLELAVAGTKDDGLLRSLSGKPGRVLKVHVCKEGCGGALTDEFLVHADEYKKVTREEAPWHTNLEEVAPPIGEDELEGLRRKAAEMAKEEGRKESPKRKKDRKKKKEKASGSKPSKKDDSSQASKERGKEKKRKPVDSEEEELENGQKSLKVVFGGTCLDPSRKSRQKLLQKAKKVGQSKKKKKKDGSSKGSDTDETISSSSTEEIDEGGLFEGDRKMQSIWRRYPGALTASAAAETRQHLVAASGAVWAVDKSRVPPVFTRYARQSLVRMMPPAMAQEAITLGHVLDGLVQGKIASSCDIVAQRLKALEASSRGSHWTVSRQLELVKVDSMMIAEDEEARQAARRAREEEKLARLVAGSIRTYEGGSQGKGGKKGKDWRGKRGRHDEGQKGGKGGDKSKDDRGGWQKKDRDAKS